MAIIPMRCPNCGANLEAEDTNESWFCQYCDTKIIKDKQYFELSEDGSFDAIASTDSLLDRAFLFIEDGDYQKAFQYLERVLDADPKCSKAYIGNLLCQLKMRKIKDLEGSEKPLTAYDNYNKAVRFANSDEASMLKALNNVIEGRFKQENLSLQSEIASIKQYLNDNKNNYNRCLIKKVAWTVLEVFCILLSVFFIIGTIVLLPYIIISAPMVICTVFVIRKNHRINKLMVEYNSKKLRLTLLNEQLSQEQQAYS